MSWITIVLWIVSNLPEMISLVKQIIDLFGTLPKGSGLRQRLSDAIQKAKESGDKSIVAGVIKDIHEKECVGIACAPHTLKP